MKRKNRRAGSAAPGPMETASATECAGLMAALPRDAEEAERLAELGGVPSPKDG